MNETQSTLNFIQRAKMIKNKTKIIENVNDTVKLLQNEIKSLKQANEELTKKINELTKENEENKKNMENLAKKYKSNNKKSRDLEDKIRQELVSEFRKNKGNSGGEKTASTEHDFDGEIQNYSSFVSKNDLKNLFDNQSYFLEICLYYSIKSFLTRFYSKKVNICPKSLLK